VITGGASGLGRATAELFVQTGANVAIFDVNETGGRELAAQLGDSRALFQRVEVSSEEEVIAALDSTVAKFGAVHICCNFAGIGGVRKTLSKEGAHPLEDFKRRIDVNLVGTFNVLRCAAERMARNVPTALDAERGVIINTASIAAFDGQMGQAAYSASKGGIVGMTLPIARDLAGFGIRVNTIVPGIIGTPLMLRAPEKVREALLTQVQFPRRFGRPEEVAHLARSIVENAYLNGECIRIDGGLRMPAR
jgi:NAD(P)-dependent dehydrogenase (short-subunit alcohol dehydrogenase family)